MAFKHSLLSFLYVPISIVNYILNLLRLRSGNQLRVIIYHDICYNQQQKFETQLRWLQRSWTFISPQKFAAMMKGEEPIKGRNLLLTFDDGFASNLQVVQDVLNPMNIKAIFFIVPEFVNIKKNDDSRAFISNYIYPNMKYENIPEDWRNMSWTDLAWLLETGHTIGNHTRTHARLSELNQVNAIETEIIKSADVIEHNLGVKIEHFAFPFGNLASFSPTALAVARSRFPFIYTGLRGDNAGKVEWAIRRDAVQPFDSLKLVGSLLEGAADLQYVASLTKYESWDKGKY